MSSWTPTTYKTANWSDNNAALKQRVSSSIWFDAEMAWEAKPSAKYQLLGTRQRKDTLFRYLAVVWFRAAMPRQALWRVGARAKVSDTYSREVDPRARVFRGEQVYDREMLSIIRWVRHKDNTEIRRSFLEFRLRVQLKDWSPMPIQAKRTIFLSRTRVTLMTLKLRNGNVLPMVD
jgi:hypothetical protein